MTLGLSEPEALNLRDGDIVLIKMRVERTNNHFDGGSGMKLVLTSPETQHTRAEREAGPKRVEIQSIYAHSVFYRELRVDDWVEGSTPDDPVMRQGRIKFILGDEVTVLVRPSQRRIMNGPLSQTYMKGNLARILCPHDLTETEKKAML